MFLPRKLRRRLSTFRRSPKIFVPVPSDRQIVIPFKPLSLFLIIFFFATTVFFLLRSDLFHVRILEFKFEELADEALVRQRISEEVLGRSTVFLNPTAVKEKIEREFLTIEAIKITKKLPDKLFINVSVRAPLGRVRIKEGRQLLVDAKGLLFREASGEKLPVIDLGESFSGSLGEVIGGKEVQAYLETLRVIEEKGLKTISIALEVQMIKLKLKTGVVVLLSVEELVPEQIELLIQILKRYRAAGRVPKRVDLRFSRPVVRF